jgi:hypothetical protein
MNKSIKKGRWSMDYYQLLLYRNFPIPEDKIINFIWDLNLEYVNLEDVDKECRCELVKYGEIQKNGEMVDTYVVFGKTDFIEKRLKKQLYPRCKYTPFRILRNYAYNLCFSSLIERAKQMKENINNRINGNLSNDEADQLYENIQKMYYIPGLEEFASPKIQNFYKIREQACLNNNSNKFIKAYQQFIAKCALLGSTKNYEPYVVGKDGQIVYYGISHQWFPRDISQNLNFFFFDDGNHRIERDVYRGTNIKEAYFYGAGKIEIYQSDFASFNNLNVFYVDKNVNIVIK